jgi:phosphopantetheine adenylyltransferase
VYLEELGYNVKTHAFADPVKDGLKAMLGLTSDDLYTEAGKSRFLDEYGMTVRQLIQTLRY